MVNYEEARVKLTNLQLCKLKPAVEYDNAATLRITTKKLSKWWIATWIFFNNNAKDKNNKYFC